MAAMPSESPARRRKSRRCMGRNPSAVRPACPERICARVRGIEYAPGPTVEGVMISFIVPAYDEERLLGPTLRAIDAAGRAQDVPFEVIVADDASADRTAAVARELGARVVSLCRRQIAAARNAGARAARGELLVFVDADTVVTPSVVRAAVDAVRDGAVGGGSRFRFDDPIPRYGKIMVAIATPLYRTFRLASGCFLFCTRDAFARAGGFDETLLAAEELAMSRALHRQGRFVVLPQAVTTSGRKLRAYSGREVLCLLAQLLLSGSSVRQRHTGLDLWYGERRADPGASDGGLV